MTRKISDQENPDSQEGKASANSERVKFNALAAIWLERAAIAEKQTETQLQAACQAVAAYCELLAESGSAKVPRFLTKLNSLRKKIEASEKHRTMCVEHGLSDAAIDATYEIQEMEKELLKTVLSIDSPA